MSIDFGELSLIVFPTSSDGPGLTVDDDPAPFLLPQPQPQMQNAVIDDDQASFSPPQLQQQQIQNAVQTAEQNAVLDDDQASFSQPPQQQAQQAVLDQEAAPLLQPQQPQMQNVALDDDGGRETGRRGPAENEGSHDEGGEVIGQIPGPYGGMLDVVANADGSIDVVDQNGDVVYAVHEDPGDQIWLPGVGLVDLERSGPPDYDTVGYNEDGEPVISFNDATDSYIPGVGMITAIPQDDGGHLWFNDEGELVGGSQAAPPEPAWDIWIASGGNGTGLSFGVPGVVEANVTINEDGFNVGIDTLIGDVSLDSEDGFNASVGIDGLAEAEFALDINSDGSWDLSAEVDTAVAGASIGLGQDANGNVYGDVDVKIVIPVPGGNITLEGGVEVQAGPDGFEGSINGEVTGSFFGAYVSVGGEVRVVIDEDGTTVDAEADGAFGTIFTGDLLTAEISTGPDETGSSEGSGIFFDEGEEGDAGGPDEGVVRESERRGPHEVDGENDGSTVAVAGSGIGIGIDSDGPGSVSVDGPAEIGTDPAAVGDTGPLPAGATDDGRPRSRDDFEDRRPGSEDDYVAGGRPRSRDDFEDRRPGSEDDVEVKDVPPAAEDKPTAGDDASADSQTRRPPLSDADDERPDVESDAEAPRVRDAFDTAATTPDKGAKDAQEEDTERDESEAGRREPSGPKDDSAELGQGTVAGEPQSIPPGPRDVFDDVMATAQPRAANDGSVDVVASEPAEASITPPQAEVVTPSETRRIPEVDEETTGRDHHESPRGDHQPTPDEPKPSEPTAEPNPTRVPSVDAASAEHTVPVAEAQLDAQPVAVSDLAPVAEAPVIAQPAVASIEADPVKVDLAPVAQAVAVADVAPVAEAPNVAQPGVTSIGADPVKVDLARPDAVQAAAPAGFADNQTVAAAPVAALADVVSAEPVAVESVLVPDVAEIEPITAEPETWQLEIEGVSDLVGDPILDDFDADDGG